MVENWTERPCPRCTLQDAAVLIQRLKAAEGITVVARERIQAEERELCAKMVEQEDDIIGEETALRLANRIRNRTSRVGPPGAALRG